MPTKGPEETKSKKATGVKRRYFRKKVCGSAKKKKFGGRKSKMKKR